MLFDLRSYRQALKPLYDLRKLRSLPDKSIIWPYIALITAFLLAMALMSGCAQAYTDKEAIQTIVGEASNQGYTGMICVGEVIRRSSSLKGFYGFKAMNHRHEPSSTWIMAKKAWYASKNTNYTHNANHFENVKAFGHPYWVKSCVLTFEYRDHRFYRE